jgi:hypothetical protein
MLQEGVSVIYVRANIDLRQIGILLRLYVDSLTAEA